jgi:hypothetical protein
MSSAGQVVMSSERGEKMLPRLQFIGRHTNVPAHRTNRSDVTFPQMSGNVGNLGHGLYDYTCHPFSANTVIVVGVASRAGSEEQGRPHVLASSSLNWTLNLINPKTPYVDIEQGVRNTDWISNLCCSRQGHGNVQLVMYSMFRGSAY